MMLWWQWLLTFGVPILVGGMGLLLGKIHLLNINKTPISSLFKSRRTSYAKDGFKTITFDKFLELYYINPKKWSWEDGYYHFWEIEGKKCGVFYIFEDKIEDIFQVTDRVELYWETEKDKRRFNKWVKDLKEKEFKERETSEYKRVLEDVQKDVKIKMDAIQKEHEAELKRIEAERKKNQTEYERLMNEVVNLARSATIPASKLVNRFSQIVPGTISYPPMPKIEYETAIDFNGNKYITQYTATTPQSNKVYIDSAHKYWLKDSNYRLMYQGQVCEYFEADCGTPYLRTPDGKILEVVFE